MRFHLIAVLLIAVVMSGCAPAPKAAAPALDTTLPPEPPSCAQGTGRYDSFNLGPPVDTNILSLLTQQWEIFGKQDVDFPPDAATVKANPKGFDEAQMWRYVQSYHLAACNRISQAKIAELPDTRRTAWSGYFISWTMVNAGVPASAFRASGYHSQYLRSMHQAQLANPGTAKFLLHEPRDYPPKVGDLVCAKRRPAPKEPVDPIRIGHFLEGTRYLSSHCDIVVSMDRSKRVIQAIGGNVQDSVSRSTFHLDAQGYLIIPKDENTAARPWFAVVENRYFPPAAIAALH